MDKWISDKNRKWWVLAALTGSNALIFLDQSVLPIALPTIQRELGFSEHIVQWSINIYLLVLAMFALAGGRIGDIIGLRKVFNWGLVIFAFASASSALSNSSEMFLISRACQGFGGAMMMPTAPGLLTAAYPHQEQGKALGLYLSVGAFFLAVGPVVGGLLTQYVSWRYVFWINIPISAIGLILTLICVQPSEKKKAAFDYLGFFGVALGIGGVITALMQVQSMGWHSWPVLTMGFGGAALLILLILFENRMKDPFIDTSLFRNRSYVLGTLSIFSTQFILMLSVFWAMYFQKILGYSPSFAGLWSMAASAPVIIIGAVSGHLFDRVGPKIPIVTGFCLVAFAIFWFVIFPTPHSPYLLIPIVLPFGCGIPLIIIPSFALFLKSASAEKKGVAVGVSTTLRQFGSTAGMAVFSVFYLHQFSSKFEELASAKPQTAMLNPETFEGLLSKAPKSIAALQSLPQILAEKVQKIFFESTVYASTSINTLGLCLTLAALLLAIIFLKKGRTKKRPR